MIIFNFLMLTIVIYQMFVIFDMSKEIKRLRSTDNRARDSRGRYVADNPNTPKNEAYK